MNYSYTEDIYIYIYILYIYIWLSIHIRIMFYMHDKLIINNEQSLKRTVAFVAKLADQVGLGPAK